MPRSGTNQLIAQWLYGSGLRLLKCLRLWVKDLDFAYRQITVRDGKTLQELLGYKDVKTMMIYTAGPQSTTRVQKR